MGAFYNQPYVAGANRVGSDPYYAYGGRSLVIDPEGEVMADAGARDGCIRAWLNLAALRKYREGFPFLADLKGRCQT